MLDFEACDIYIYIDINDTLTEDFFFFNSINKAVPFLKNLGK